MSVKSDIIKCNRCENQFIPKHGRHTKFCSKACSDQNSTAICYCAKCSKRFEVKHIRKYCSIECNPHKASLNLDVRICLECNKPYKPRYKRQKYCSSNCHPYANHSDNKYYQTKEWKLIRAAFIESYTAINGIAISNKYCIECYIKQNRLNDMYAVDHKIRLKDGGDHSFDNLQSLCEHHHQSKSAHEGNKRYREG